MPALVVSQKNLRSQVNADGSAARKRQSIPRAPIPVPAVRTVRGRAQGPVDNESNKQLISCERYATARGNFGLINRTFTVTPYGPMERLMGSGPRFPDEILTLGRTYCSSHNPKLDELEAIIMKLKAGLGIGRLPRKTDGAVDAEALKKFDHARLEYRALLFDIILEAANNEIQQGNPAAAFAFSASQPYDLQSEIVTPQKNTKLIIDTVNNTPAMLLYLHPELVADFETTSFFGGFGHTFTYELALQMKLHNKLSFQGIGCNGLLAQVSMARVRRLDDNLQDHKTDVSYAMYSLPSQRLGFVADMVQLIQNHRNFSKLYTTSDRNGRWSNANGGKFVHG